MSALSGTAGTGVTPRNVVTRHPNASVAFGSGSGLGVLIVWCVGLAGATMPPEVGAALAGALAATALFIGRRDVRGTLWAIWNGS